MFDYRLPDGTWVTTPICVGTATDMTPQCADCAWADYGPVVPAADATSVPYQMQRCAKCGWQRAKYLGNPHPEVAMPEG